MSFFDPNVVAEAARLARSQPEPPQAPQPTQRGAKRHATENDPSVATFVNGGLVTLPPRPAVPPGEEDILDPLKHVTPSVPRTLNDQQRALLEPSRVPVDFKLVLFDSTPFRTLVELIAPVLTDVEFLIKATPTFCGLMVRALDDSHVAMIIAALRFEHVEPAHIPDGMRFCVNTKVFTTAVRTIKDNSCLEMWRQTGDSKIHLRGTSSSNRCELAIPTVDKVYDTNALSLIGFDLRVIIDLQNLRSMVKLAQSETLNVSDMRLRIRCGSKRGFREVPQGENMPPKQEPVIYMLSYVRWTVEEDNDGMSVDHEFRVVTVAEEQTTGTMIVVKSKDEGDPEIKDEEVTNMTEIYDEKFSAKHLQLFTKSMERPAAELCLATAKPLVMRYPLGGGQDSVNRVDFVLAPRNKNEGGDGQAYEGDKAQQGASVDDDE